MARDDVDGAQFDAIVVGAGAAGSLVTKELTEGGLTVLLLEAGPSVAEEDLPRDARAGAGALGRAWCSLTGQPVQARGILFSRGLRRLYVYDRRHPYVTAASKPFLWFRGRQVGGRLHTWARVVPRMSDAQFKAASRDGVGLDWPIDHAELAPHYSRVERFLGVYGRPDGVPMVPDGEMLAPWPQTTGERAFRARLAERMPGLSVLDARVARHDPAPVPPGIRAARATGRLRLRADAVAERVLLETEGPGAGTRARGVVLVDARTGERSTALASRAIFLCAGTVETNRLLLASACRGHERGLGNSSGLLGRCLVDHTMVYAAGPAAREAPPTPDGGPPDPRDLGIGTGFYVPRFQNLGEGDDAPFLRGYGLQGSVGRGRAAWALTAFGEVLPSPENRITLDPDRRDALGLPVPRFDFEYGPNERAMIAHMRASLDEIARAGGLETGRRGLREPVRRAVHALGRRRLYGADGALLPGSSNHQVGGARMGADPATSVVDASNRLWDVPNVLVTDGACFPSSGFQNVALTLMALSVRAAELLLTDDPGERRTEGP